MINSINDLRKAFRHGPYAWPGGYPVYFVLADGEALSFEAAKAERRQLLEAVNDYRTHRGLDRYNDQWRPLSLEINWEDQDLFCAHTGKRIESAYAEPE